MILKVLIILKKAELLLLEYPDYYFVNASYVPNRRWLTRLDYRMLWEDDLRAHLVKLDKIKPVIYCGDLNVAHQK